MVVVVLFAVVVDVLIEVVVGVLVVIVVVVEAPPGIGHPFSLTMQLAHSELENPSQFSCK